MAKAAKTVKWALGAEEPEDLQDFLTNDDLVKKNKKKGEVMWPGKGPHTFVLRRMSVKDNKNGDPRIAVMLILQNGKKADQKWNGYCIFDGFNVTEQGAPFLKRFLKALGLTWEDFIKKTKAVEDGDKQQIQQIGQVKIGEAATKDVTLSATIRVKPADDYNDDEHMEIGRYLPVEDEEEEEPEDMDDADVEDEDEDEDGIEVEEDEDEEDEEEDEEDEDEDEEDEEDDDEEEEDEDEEEELREELRALKIPELKKRAIRLCKRLKGDTDDIPTKKADLIDYIVQCELGEPPF